MTKKLPHSLKGKQIHINPKLCILALQAALNDYHKNVTEKRSDSSLFFKIAHSRDGSRRAYNIEQQLDAVLKRDPKIPKDPPESNQILQATLETVLTDKSSNISQETELQIYLMIHTLLQIKTIGFGLADRLQNTLLSGMMLLNRQSTSPAVTTADQNTMLTNKQAKQMLLHAFSEKLSSDPFGLDPIFYAKKHFKKCLHSDNPEDLAKYLDSMTQPFSSNKPGNPNP